MLAAGFRQLRAAYRLVTRGGIVEAQARPADARAAHKRFLATATVALEPRVTVSRESISPLLARTTVTPSVESGKTMVFVHGGGFVFHDVQTFLPFLARIAGAARCRVVAFDYPKAPECHPGQIVKILSDAVEREARATFESEGSVHLLGDSIGALIVLSASWTRLSGLKPHIGLLNPMLVAPGRSFASELEFARGHFLELEFLDWFRLLALEGLRGCLSPLEARGREFSALGSLVVWSAQCDMLRDEARAFVELGRTFGRDVEHTIFAGMPHDFPLFAARVPEANDAVTRLEGHIERWLNGGSP